MSEKTISIQVESTWDSGNQKSPKDAVTLKPFSAHKRNEDGVQTDMVQLGSCVLLCQPSEENGNQDAEAQPCSISLQLDLCSPFVIASVIIVCEARMVEVYGAYKEYLKTIPAELLDEIGDSAVYCAEIDFPQVTHECTLKFARLMRPTEMWLYGVKVLWKIQNDFSMRNSQTLDVNFETVDQRLKESQSQLTERAESCKKFLKMYSLLNDGKKSLQGFPEHMSLFSLIPAMSQRLTSRTSHTAQSLQNEASCTVTSSASSGHSSKESEMSICHGCSQKIDSVLGKKLVLMETRIMEAFGEKIAALQKHQDRQMQSLFNLLENVAVGGNPKFKTHSETAHQTQSPEDLKIELAIKKLMGGNAFSHSQEDKYRSNTCDGNADKILRNAFMALKLDKMIAETSHQSEVDNVPTVVQNGP